MSDGIQRSKAAGRATMLKRVVDLDGRERIEIGIGRIERVATICLLWAFAAYMALVWWLVTIDVAASLGEAASIQRYATMVVLECVTVSLLTGCVAGAAYYQFASPFRQKIIITSEYIEKIGPGTGVRHYWKDYKGGEPSQTKGNLMRRIFSTSPPVLRFHSGDLSLSYFGRLTPHGTELGIIREMVGRCTLPTGGEE
jgi:hypothetical protein